MGGHLLVDHEYFLKKIGKSICISKNSVYFSVSIEKINLPEISLSYLKSRWLKIRFVLALRVAAMFIALQ